MKAFKKTRKILAAVMAFSVLGAGVPAGRCKADLGVSAILGIVSLSIFGVYCLFKGVKAIHKSRMDRKEQAKINNYFKASSWDRPQLRESEIEPFILLLSEKPDQVVQKAFGNGATEQMYEFVRALSEFIKKYGVHEVAGLVRQLQKSDLGDTTRKLSAQDVAKDAVITFASGNKIEFEKLAELQEKALLSVGKKQIQAVRRMLNANL